MTSGERIRKEYSNPNSREFNGQSTKQNIAKYAERASELSDGHRHRAKSGEMELPDTNRGAGILEGTRSGDQHAKALRNLNHSGKDTDYMPRVRRTT
jgi:hypothetical protein